MTRKKIDDKLVGLVKAVFATGPWSSSIDEMIFWGSKVEKAYFETDVLQQEPLISKT